MKHTLSRVCGALSVALLMLAPNAANAQAIHYQNADGYNTTPVSAATPLPVSGSFTGSSASVGTSGSAIPTSSDLIGSKDGSGNLQPASSANPIPVSIPSTSTVQLGTTPACGSVMPISQTASTDLHTASGKTYICSIILIVPDAEVVSIVEGTGSVCATGVAALVGSTTAANGMSLSANGGFTATAATPFLAMQTTSDHLCLLQSGSGRIAGVITYNDH